MTKKPNNREKPKLGALYPHLTDEERARVEYTIQRYVNLVWRIYRHSKRAETKNIDGKSFKR